MQSVTPDIEPPPPDATPAELVREVMVDARELVRLEVALAKEEIKREIVAGKNAGIALGVAAAVLLLGAAMLLVALALAIFPGPVPALVLGLVLCAIAALSAVTGVKLLPKKPLDETRRRVETDIRTMKERMT